MTLQGLALCLGTVVLWGVGMFVAKPAMERLNWWYPIVFGTVTSAVVVGAFELLNRANVLVLDAKAFKHDAFTWEAFGICALGSVCMFAGTIFYIIALKSAPVSIVSAVTALYPVVAISLAMIFYREKVSLVQAAGVVLILAGLALVSYKFD